MTAALVASLAALVVAALAALVDARTGRIPGWLTVPVLVLGPLGWGLVGGGVPLVYALGSSLACALVPLLLRARGAIGGGDVKLAAALGGLVGARLGLEVLLAAFTAVALVAIGRLIWEGELTTTLLRGTVALLSRRAPDGPRRELPAPLRERVRFAPYVLVGALYALLPALVFA